MATKAQIEAVIDLHKIDDRLKIIGEYSATEPYDITAGGSYTDQDGLHGMGDPYELAQAQIALGVLYPIVTTVNEVTIDGEPDPTVAQMESGYQYTATVTFFNDVGGEDDTVTWSINNLGLGNTSTYSIASETGFAGSVSSATAGDTFDIVATSNFDGTTIGTENILVEL